MKWSSITKFLLGSILGIAILVGGGLAIGYYFMTRLTQLPPKPMFANDAQPKKAASPSSSDSANAAAEPDLAADPATPPPLEPGTYRAQVIYSGGLLLRDSPSVDSSQIGGVAYNQQVVVLEESTDQSWQRVRLESGEEGWVKAGNMEQVE